MAEEKKILDIAENAGSAADSYLQLKHYKDINRKASEDYKTILQKAEPFVNYVPRVDDNGRLVKDASGEQVYDAQLYVGDGSQALANLDPINYPEDHKNIEKLEKSLKENSDKINSNSAEIDSLKNSMINSSCSFGEVEIKKELSGDRYKYTATIPCEMSDMVLFEIISDSANYYYILETHMILPNRTSGTIYDQHYNKSTFTRDKYGVKLDVTGINGMGKVVYILFKGEYDG